ncbi:hypothetical protein SDC9_134913 [bioreactor metagenome]|uniref:Uncharacterized protein n=1 Tax=bioreactor metagenome TaxID=1076179 RepID=A0A645DG63_9ZZZZ
MHKRCSEYCRTRGCSSNPCNNLNINIFIIIRKLKHKTCHSVNACIAAANYRYNLTAFGPFKCHNASFFFLAHRRCNPLFIWKVVFHQISINCIPHNHIAFIKNINRSYCQTLVISGSYSYYIQLSLQNIHSNLLMQVQR